MGDSNDTDVLSSNPFNPEHKDDDFSLNLMDPPTGVVHTEYNEDDEDYGALSREHPSYIASDTASLLSPGDPSSGSNNAPTKTSKSESSMSDNFASLKSSFKEFVGMVKHSVEPEENQLASRSELAQKESDLLKREEVLKQRESECGIVHKEPNWPLKCYPLCYHDIDEEVPARYRKLVRRLYLCLLANWVCLLLNWIVVLMAVIGGTKQTQADSDALWASVYLFLGVPASWKLWYSRAYYGSRKNKTGGWIFFFVSFGSHTLFCCVMALGVPNTASGGLFFMFKMINNSLHFAAFMSFCCSALWAVEASVCVFLFKSAHNQWRGGNVQQNVFDEQSANVAVNVLSDAAASSL